MKYKNLLVPIIFNLKNKNGHVYNYHFFIKEICLRNNIDYKPIVFSKIRFFFAKNQLPIYNSALDNSFIGILKLIFLFKIKSVYKDIIFFYEKLKDLVSQEQSRKINFFLESFNLFNLIVLIYFATNNQFNKNLYYFILIRTHPKNGNFITSIYYKIISLSIINFIKSFNKNNFKLITDTEILNQQLNKIYNHKFYYLPVPTFYSNYKIREKLNRPSIIFPGEIRKDKNIKDMIYISSRIKFDKYMSVFFKKIFKHKNINKIIYMNDGLSFIKYYNYIKKSDISILTLKPKFYKYSSSGTFIDSIVNRSIPLVYRGTSMSVLLRQNNLSELIMINKYNFINFINKYFNDNVFKNKIDKKFLNLHKKIRIMHSKEFFEKSFLHILK